MSYLSVLRKSLDAHLADLEDELDTNAATVPVHLLNVHPCSLLDDPANPPSKRVIELIEKIQVDLKAIESTITPSQFKLVQLANSQYKSAALGAAVNLDIAGAIEALGGEATLKELAKRTDTNEHKLGRTLRSLAAEFLFLETSHDTFRNTRHSINLITPGARSFLSFITDIGMKSASGIPRDLIDPDSKDSFVETSAPFARTVSNNGQTFAQYMGDPHNATMVELGNEGIVGWLNKLTRAALLHDYPWEELGDATVIDLGAGMGDSGMDVMRQYPQLRWIYQDLPTVIESLQKDFPADLGDRTKDGTIKFVKQDYFEPNISDGDVWYMRGVLHEYDDDKALVILQHLKVAMKRTVGSRVIINEVLNSSPVIMQASSNSAPSACIPARQSAFASLANSMTWSTFSLFGGKERSYLEYESLLNRAGLKISRFFSFRTFTVMIEAVVA